MFEFIDKLVPRVGLEDTGGDDYIARFLQGAWGPGCPVGGGLTTLTQWGTLSSPVTRFWCKSGCSRGSSRAIFGGF